MRTLFLLCWAVGVAFAAPALVAVGSDYCEAPDTILTYVEDHTCGCVEPYCLALLRRQYLLDHPPDPYSPNGGGYYNPYDPYNAGYVATVTGTTTVTPEAATVLVGGGGGGGGGGIGCQTTQTVTTTVPAGQVVVVPGSPTVFVLITTIKIQLVTSTVSSMVTSIVPNAQNSFSVQAVTRIHTVFATVTIMQTQFGTATNIQPSSVFRTTVPTQTVTATSVNVQTASTSVTATQRTTVTTFSTFTHSTATTVTTIFTTTEPVFGKRDFIYVSTPEALQGIPEDKLSSVCSRLFPLRTTTTYVTETAPQPTVTKGIDGGPGGVVGAGANDVPGGPGVLGSPGGAGAGAGSGSICYTTRTFQGGFQTVTSNRFPPAGGGGGGGAGGPLDPGAQAAAATVTSQFTLASGQTTAVTQVATTYVTSRPTVDLTTTNTVLATARTRQITTVQVPSAVTALVTSTTTVTVTQPSTTTTTVTGTVSVTATDQATQVIDITTTRTVTRTRTKTVYSTDSYSTVPCVTNLVKNPNFDNSPNDLTPWVHGGDGLYKIEPNESGLKIGADDRGITGRNSSSIAQPLKTTIGTAYVLSFVYVSFNGDDSSTLTCFVDTNPQASVVYQLNTQPDLEITGRLNFTASATTTTLTCRLDTSVFADVQLDNFRIPVPC